MSDYYEKFTNEQIHHALAKAVAERDEARACYEQAAKAVAEMHAAAMGCVCGPVKSVVGDIEYVRQERDKLKAWIDGLEVVYTKPEGRLWKETFIVEAAK